MARSKQKRKPKRIPTKEPRPKALPGLEAMGTPPGLAKALRALEPPGLAEARKALALQESTEAARRRQEQNPGREIDRDLATEMYGRRATPAQPTKKRKHQADRIDTVLRKIYPPDGIVPEDVPTMAVHRQLGMELEAENRRLGLVTPSYDTVARRLGRQK